MLSKDWRCIHARGFMQIFSVFDLRTYTTWNNKDNLLTSNFRTTLVVTTGNLSSKFLFSAFAYWWQLSNNFKVIVICVSFLLLGTEEAVINFRNFRQNFRRRESGENHWFLIIIAERNAKLRLSVFFLFLLWRHGSQQEPKSQYNVIISL